MISIIIPLYNKENSIHISISSILDQNFEDFEVVIIDDGSTDNSVNKVFEFKDKRIKLYKKNNGGPASARNYGVNKAEGEWIIFLDADDSLLPGALKHFYNLSKEYPHINCFSGNFLCKKNKRILPFAYISTSKILRNNFWEWNRKRCYLRPGAAMYRKNIIANLPFSTCMRRNEDVEWMFKILANNKIYRSAKQVMIYNCDNLQASNVRSNIYEDYLAYLDFNEKELWKRVALFGLYLQCKRCYPNEYKKLYPNVESLLLFILHYYIKVLNKLSKIFHKTF